MSKKKGENNTKTIIFHIQLNMVREQQEIQKPNHIHRSSREQFGKDINTRDEGKEKKGQKSMLQVPIKITNWLIL